MNIGQLYPKTVSALKAGCLIGIAVLLNACEFKKPDYPRVKGIPLTVTLSSDGQLLAVLDRDSNSERRLRIKWLNKDEPWQALPLPKYTSNIQFALEGYDLLLSHRLPDNTDVGQITRWNVTDLSQPSEIIRQGPFYAFPLEVKPGSYLVRTCEPIESKNPNRPNKNRCQSSGLGSYWVLLAPGAEPLRVTPKTIQPVYSQPNVADQGFFWTSDYVVGHGPYSRENKPTTHPMLLTFPLPGGEAPQVAVEHLSPESKLVCNRTIERCLRQYRRGTHPVTSDFIYDTEVIYRGQSCPIEGVQGFADEAVITPNGRAAAIPVAPVFEQARRVVVVNFQDGQCAPTSTQTLTFEEK
jgi:hypothetical protein